MSAGILAASPASADAARPIVNENFSDFAPAIAELRKEAGQDRRNIVAANMYPTYPLSWKAAQYPANR